MTLQSVLMNLEVPDTKEGLSYKMASVQVSVVLQESHMGCTTLIQCNNSRGRRYESKHKKFEGHHRGTNGPITSLALKIANHPV